jgi:hypothetical protein
LLPGKKQKETAAQSKDIFKKYAKRYKWFAFFSVKRRNRFATFILKHGQRFTVFIKFKIKLKI